MVQYGVYLETFRNPAWAAHYLSYESLKVLVYDLEKAMQAKRISIPLFIFFTLLILSLHFFY